MGLTYELHDLNGYEYSNAQLHQEGHVRVRMEKRYVSWHALKTRTHKFPVNRSVMGLRGLESPHTTCNAPGWDGARLRLEDVAAIQFPSSKEKLRVLDKVPGAALEQLLGYSTSLLTIGCFCPLGLTHVRVFAN
eukprot:5344227-Amphidinium_carterae.2